MSIISLCPELPSRPIPPPPLRTDRPYRRKFGSNICWLNVPMQSTITGSTTSTITGPIWAIASQQSALYEPLLQRHHISGVLLIGPTTALFSSSIQSRSVSGPFTFVCGMVGGCPRTRKAAAEKCFDGMGSGGITCQNFHG